MSVLQIQHEISRLPQRQRDSLMKRLAKTWEDYIDMKIALEALAEGLFVRWSDVKKRLDAKHSHLKQAS